MNAKLLLDAGKIRIRTSLSKWRLAFLIFALSYAVLLILNLSNQPIQWDEIVHLNGGLFLKLGQYSTFIHSSFYPPLYDSITMVFYDFFGVSVFSARLVSAVFGVLSLWIVFELAYRAYGGKAAIISAILLAVMPGYFWLSRLALLEIMLLFFFLLSLYFFYCWLNNHQNKLLVLSGLALGLGFLAKYQVLSVLVVMIVTLVVLGRGHLKHFFKKFALLIIVAALVVLPWIVIVYQVYASQFLNQWVYALEMGNPGKSVYSTRFPVPIFYFIEMTWPYSNGIHPITVLLFVVGMVGLGLFAWQRKREDKFILIWFVSVFVFFTLISNREWRYVTTLFPAVAIAASTAILYIYDKAKSRWTGHLNPKKESLAKIAAVLFTVLLIVGLAYSVYDNYYAVQQNNIQIEISQATNYAAARDAANQSIILLCPFNLFSADMVKFYLIAEGKTEIQTYQYPQLPVDSYTPTFNINEFIALCKSRNVRFVFTYEYGGTVPYFNTTLNLAQIYMQIYASGNFSQISPEATFGANPRRILVLNFTG